jgi:hypothetical protein
MLVDEYGRPFVTRDRRVRITKRNGKQFEGATQDDGLRSLFAVTLEDGTIEYATVLDQIEWLS